jgi:hypothetical protein
MDARFFAQANILDSSWFFVYRSHRELRAVFHLYGYMDRKPSWLPLPLGYSGVVAIYRKREMYALYVYVRDT